MAKCHTALTMENKKKGVARQSSVTAEEMIEAIFRPIDLALEKEGLTPTYLARKLVEELEATTVRAFNSNGKVIYSKPLVAWDIRQEARKDAHKLRNHYPAVKAELTGKDGAPLFLQYVVPGEEQKAIDYKVDEDETA